MKTKLAGLTACLLAMAIGSPVAAQISSSAHNFSTAAWNPGGELCVVCHTPHNADGTVVGSPLWNHELTTSTFTLYSSSTLDGGPLAQPSGQSLLCLSCHDGTVALDNFGGTTTGNQLMDSVNVDTNVGTDLSNDHPVSFAYDAALFAADGELVDPSETAVADLLFSGNLECASCHDVHNSTGLTSLLRVDNAGSGLCFTCHAK